MDRIWGATRDDVYKASFDSVGTTKRRHQDWFDENDQCIQSLLENKRVLHQMTLTQNATEAAKSRYRDACHEVQAKLRVMKDEWWDAKATEVQGFADRHEEKEFYAALKEVYGSIHSATVLLKSSDGSALLPKEQKYWQDGSNTSVTC